MIHQTVDFINKVFSAKKTARWGDVYPFLSFEDGFLITRKGDYSIVYELTLPTVHSLSPSDYESMNSSFAQVIEGFGSGYAVQRIDFFYQDYGMIEVADSSYAAYKNRINAICKKTSKNKSYLIITRIAEQNGKRRPKDIWIELVSKKNVSGFFANKHYEGDELENFFNKAEGILDVFKKGVGSEKAIKYKKLDEFEVHDFVNRMYLNLDFEKNEASTTINKVGEHDAFGTTGNKVFNVLSMKADGLPVTVADHAFDADYTKEGVYALPVSYMHYAGFRLPFPHIVITTIFTKTKDDILESLNKKRKLFTNTGKISAYNANQAVAVTSLLAEYEGRSTAMMVEMDFSIIVCGNANEPKEYASYIGQANNFFSHFKIEVTDNGYNSLAAFLSRIPGCASDIPAEDCSVLLSTHASCFQVLEQGMKSVSNGVLFTDRKTEAPYSLDLFEHPAITNKNMAIFGPSGTGKSFTFNHLIHNYIDNGNSVMMIDLGGSYEFLNKYVGGLNFKCTEDEPLKLNPFLFVKRGPTGDYLRPTEDDSEFITNLVFTAWQSANSQAKITSEVNAVLKELIIGFFENCNSTDEFPDFTNFYHYTKDQFENNKYYTRLTERHFDKESFLLVMRAFVAEGRGLKEGQYSYLFNPRENPDVLNNPFVIFELEQIKENKVLLPISFYIVTRIVLEKLLKRADKRQRIYYILDEAWMLLAREDLGEVAGLFIEYSFRTFRKHGGSISIATQNVSDILTNKRVGAAILQNCDTLLIKKQDEKNMEYIREALNMNEHSCNMLFSIKDKHKEIYMQFKDQGMVAKIETSMYNTGMYSTDPKHKEFIRETLKANGNNLHGALIKFEDKFSNQKNK